MLNTPLLLQQCSSSPISGRAGSVLSVVLPVPARTVHKFQLAICFTCMHQRWLHQGASGAKPGTLTMRLPMILMRAASTAVHTDMAIGT